MVIDEQDVGTALTLANAASIIADIILDVAGNDISNSSNGQSITRDLIEQVAAQDIVNELIASEEAK